MLLKVLFGAIAFFVGFKFLKSLLSTGTINNFVVEQNASKSISSLRKVQLDDVADKVYGSMDGLGTWNEDWKRQMKKVNSDPEYIYMVSSFGKREGANLAEWISSEAQITASEINEVNNNYKNKGMTTRI